MFSSARVASARTDASASTSNVSRRRSNSRPKRSRAARASRLSRPRASGAFDWTPSDPRALRLAEPGAKPLRVAVLLSGGVDSSVALALLRAAGHECVAFYLQIWFQEDFRNTWDQCPWEEDLRVAESVCERVGVPLETVPLTDE